MVQCFSFTKDGKSVEYKAKATARSLESKINMTHGIPSYMATWATEHHQSTFASVVMALGTPVAQKKFNTADKVACSGSLQWAVPVATPNRLPEMLRKFERPLLASLPSLSPPVLQYLDPKTLDVVCSAPLLQQNSHLKGTYTTPHLQQDPITKDWFGCVMDYEYGVLGPNVHYQVYALHTDIPTVEVVATVKGRFGCPGIVHSFALTPNYIILV